MGKGSLPTLSKNNELVFTSLEVFQDIYNSYLARGVIAVSSGGNLEATQEVQVTFTGTIFFEPISVSCQVVVKQPNRTLLRLNGPLHQDLIDLSTAPTKSSATAVLDEEEAASEEETTDQATATKKQKDEDEDEGEDAVVIFAEDETDQKTIGKKKTAKKKTTRKKATKKKTTKKKTTKKKTTKKKTTKKKIAKEAPKASTRKKAAGKSKKAKRVGTEESPKKRTLPTLRGTGIYFPSVYSLKKTVPDMEEWGSIDVDCDEMHTAGEMLEVHLWVESHKTTAALEVTLVPNRDTCFTLEFSDPEDIEDAANEIIAADRKGKRKGKGKGKGKVSATPVDVQKKSGDGKLPSSDKSSRESKTIPEPASIDSLAQPELLRPILEAESLLFSNIQMVQTAYEKLQVSSALVCVLADSQSINALQVRLTLLDKTLEDTRFVHCVQTDEGTAVVRFLVPKHIIDDLKTCLEDNDSLPAIDQGADSDIDNDAAIKDKAVKADSFRKEIQKEKHVDNKSTISSSKPSTVSNSPIASPATVTDQDLPFLSGSELHFPSVEDLLSSEPNFMSPKGFSAMTPSSPATAYQATLSVLVDGEAFPPALAATIRPSQADTVNIRIRDNTLVRSLMRSVTNKSRSGSDNGSVLFHENGEFHNPTNGKECLALPLVRAPTAQEANIPSMPLLIRYLMAQPGITQIKLSINKHEYTLYLVDRVELRCEMGLDLVAKMCSKASGTYSFSSVSSAPNYKNKAPPLHFMAAIIRNVLKDLPMDRLRSGLHIGKGKLPEVNGTGGRFLQLLPFSASQVRLASMRLNGSSSLEEIIASPIGPRASWELIYLLEIFEGLTWGTAKEKPKSIARKNDLSNVFEELQEKDHFEVLGLHWSSSPRKLKPALLEIKKKYGPGSQLAHQDPDNCNKIWVLSQAAFKELSTQQQRQNYREKHFTLVWAQQADLMLNQVRLCLYRDAISEAKDRLEAVRDIAPDNDDAKLLAKQIFSPHK